MFLQSSHGNRDVLSLAEYQLITKSVFIDKAVQDHKNLLSMSVCKTAMGK